jgi:hypothetical protein
MMLVFVLATVCSFSQFYPAFGAAQFFGKSGSFKPSKMQGQPFLHVPLIALNWLVWMDSAISRSSLFSSFQSAPTVEPSEPVENKVYAQSRWVGGGCGVQFLEPGYWTVSKQAANH